MEFVNLVYLMIKDISHSLRDKYIGSGTGIGISIV